MSDCTCYKILQNAEVLLQTTRNDFFSCVPVESGRLCGYRVQKTVPLSTQKVFSTLQDTAPVRMTNTKQNQFEPIMTSADTMQDVLTLLFSHTCA